MSGVLLVGRAVAQLPAYRYFLPFYYCITYSYLNLFSPLVLFDEVNVPVNNIRRPFNHAKHFLELFRNIPKKWVRLQLK